MSIVSIQFCYDFHAYFAIPAQYVALTLVRLYDRSITSEPELGRVESKIYMVGSNFARPLRVGTCSISAFLGRRTGYHTHLWQHLPVLAEDRAC